MKNFKQLNIILGWLSFAIAAITYILTMEPTTSFWDCGEFIASAYKLQVGHPPGAPFFMITGRFFSLFASDVSQVAKMVNLLSALASAFTILFLFWTITHLARKMMVKNNEISLADGIVVLGSGLVGALAYTFSDTFWFSAVEGEVYASSSFFTAVVFWAILKWENVADEKYANRWLILIAYLMGLSIGVHLLNLLAIPAIVFVFYLKKYQVNRKGILAASAVSVVLLAVIMYGIIPGLVTVASWFELFFVNTLGMGYKSGVLFYAILLIGSFIFGIYYSHLRINNNIAVVCSIVAVFLLGIPFMSDKVFITILLIGIIIGALLAIKKHVAIINTILIGFAVIVIGYSSFAMIVIRSNANPPMDQNNPETLFGLQYYLNREQYGDRPLIHGQYYNAPITGTKEGRPTYTQINNRYEITNRKLDYEFDDRFLTVFPRMYSREQHHIKAYENWGKVKGKSVRITNGRGEQQVIKKPTMLENVRFFFKYQVGHMYLRYFLWNYAGRQNDIQGNGFNDNGSKDVMQGNWISGIKFIDEWRLGPQENMPGSIKNHKARNTYYFLPLILGLIGFFFHYKRHNKDFWIVTLLFILTGLAIVVYLNQTPFQPRERDYAYAGSFYAFSIWIGLGVLGLVELMRKKIPHLLSAGVGTAVCLVLVPGIMASENWDDHDRSGRYTARDFAYNYLNSCQQNAIIFTNGDNDTFPLWYIQEVEGVRTDVRVVNLSYLSADWYIKQMQRKAYESDPLPINLTIDKYRQGKRDIVYLEENKNNSNVDLKKAMDWVASDDKRTKQSRGYDGELFNYIPSKSFVIPVDSADIINKKVVSEAFFDQITDIEWKINRRYITKNGLIVLDMLANNNWERPIYFAITVARDNYMDLEPYFQTHGLAYKVVPVKSPTERGQVTGIDTDIMFENMVHNFKWGGINESDVYLDENNLRMLSNFRNNFSRLAEALIREGKNDKALQSLDRAMEVMPHNKVPFNYFMLPYADLYYQLNETEKAEEIIKIMNQENAEKIEYYLQFKNALASSVEYELRLSMHIVQESLRMAQKYGSTELKEEIENKFDSYLMRMNVPS